MFYQHPEINGSIRNLRQYYRQSMQRNVWAYEIYLDDILVVSEDSDWDSQTRDQAITNAKAIGNRIKQRELVKRELAAVGKQLYVKLNDIGKYSIFVQGKLYCIGCYDLLEDALQKLQNIKAEIANEKAIFNEYRY
ncbi:hypothetical protein [Cylindrospermum sp. FACHB-282]|uniref:hypothetical protein n=1 Tax=Cylindrospermum sp. FACHB-282 TaxID=2692794 RepID=UPI001689A0D6|nr:hypothetical protein [Cylindrospermum sp. FACHB-282]MBD2386009.1 hypothetical protein [Cylindrospermum sp. FACHB-282]